VADFTVSIRGAQNAKQQGPLTCRQSGMWWWYCPRSEM